MNRTILTSVLAALALALGAGPVLAQGKPAPADAATSRTPPKKKPAPRVKPVDINTASKADLKKVAGLSDEYAEKIVAGRPYVSKADLVTRKVIPEGVYVQIKRRIVSLPPKPGAGKKAAKP